MFGSAGAAGAAGMPVAGTGPPGVGRSDASGTGAVGVLEHPSSSAATPAATPADKVSRFFALNTKTISESVETVL
jgi:hypothetical protein